MKKDKTYTHQEYRNAKVIHLNDDKQEEKFYFKQKEITKEEADQITQQHYEQKNRFVRKGMNYGK